MVSMAAIGVLAVVVFVNIGHIQASVIDQLIQLLAYVIEGTVLYLVLRSRLQKRGRVQSSLQLLAHQRAIDQARNQFISDSVAIVGGALQALATNVVNVQSNEQAKFIVNGYQKLTNLIGKFQLAIQVEGGQLGHAKQHFTVRQMVDKVVADHQAAATAKKVQLSVTGQDGQLVQSRDTLELVLASLVDNAVKFSPEGQPVSVAYDYAGASSSITITDHGPGMTEQQAAQLFQPFTRTESALVFSYEGLGFSLFLDRLLMKHLEGDIQLKSQPGRGTAVTMTLASDLSGRETIVIQPSKLQPPRPRFSPLLMAATVLLISALLVTLYLSYYGRLGVLGGAVWTVLGFGSVFVVGSWLAVVFGIIEPDSRHRE